MWHPQSGGLSKTCGRRYAADAIEISGGQGNSNAPRATGAPWLGTLLAIGSGSILVRCVMAFSPVSPALKTGMATGDSYPNRQWTCAHPESKGSG
jgi:hypothetical protein